MVEALLDELPTEPVLPKLEDELDDVEELADVGPVVEVVEPVEPVVVAVPAEAYAAARCSPRPPAASVVASRTPAVQRRVVDRARLVRRLVMRRTFPTGARPIL